MKKNIDPGGRHPCFNGCAGKKYGRIHLPVASHCNIQCNYCNRSYDCVNESRPGVSSFLLKPAEVGPYLERILKKEKRLTVAGIAGPGDPLCNPETTLETLRQTRAVSPDLLLCVSSNGLNVAPHAHDLHRAGVRHMTITVNAVDPEIGGRIYKWIRLGKSFHFGREGAAILLKRQLVAIRHLKKLGMVVKVNTVVVPGINDRHVTEIAEQLAALQVDLMNCIPMLPVAGTPFADIVPASRETIAQIRGRAEKHLPQMRHCVRCRADAVGLLTETGAGSSTPRKVTTMAAHSS